jgi:hypothetical protein
MTHFHMSFDEVMKSPYQRLLLLAMSIPKTEGNDDESENKKSDILSFARNNNLIRKK